MGLWASVGVGRALAPFGARKIRPALGRQALGLAPAPLLDPLVVAREEDVGDRQALPFARLRKLRVLEEAILEAAW